MVCLSSGVRGGLRVEALDRLPFSLLRFFWASKRNEGAHQIKLAKITNTKQKIFKHTLSVNKMHFSNETKKESWPF